MAKEKRKPNRSRLQRIVNDIEWGQSITHDPQGRDFNRLCRQVASTNWWKQWAKANKYAGGADDVRKLILSMEIETQSNPADPITIDNLFDAFMEGRPLAVCDGVGVNSTSLLIYLARRYHETKRKRPQFKPSVITFADTGSEKKETYDYMWVMHDYLKAMKFPAVVIVQYKPERHRVKNGWYHTLEQQCLVNRCLPSWAYKLKKCSAKWKIGPQNKYRAMLPEFQEAWSNDMQAVCAIGYDASPTDSRRSFKITDDQAYQYWYPLIQLGWDRDRCIEEIRKEGLPGWADGTGRKWIKKGGVPVKSACWFCPSISPEELIGYSETEHGRDYLRAIVRMEDNAADRLHTITGLWGHDTKKRTGRMGDFIEEHGLLEGSTSLPIVDQFDFEDCEQCAGCF